jgi:hypothetical protein
MPFPAIEFCIISEGLRQELGGKATILGFYGLAPHVDVLTPTIAQHLSIAFAIGFGVGPPQQYNSYIAIFTMNGEFIAQSAVGTVTSNPLVRGLLGIPLIVRFPAQGAYIARLFIDGREVYQTRFGVREPNPEEARRIWNLK